MSTGNFFYEQFIPMQDRCEKYRPEVKRQKTSATLKRGGATYGL